MKRTKLGAATVLAVVIAGLSAVGAQATSATTQTAQADPASAVALAILKEIGVGAAQGGGNKGLAHALSLMGIGGDPGTTAQLAEIQRLLERVDTQLTSLRNETAAISKAVNESNYNNAAREALPILNAVDHAEAKLKSAATHPAGSPGQKLLAEEARSYIGAHLLDKGRLLATLVSGSGPFAPDSIFASAWKVRTQDNFLTHTDSVQLRYLVDYYTAYEAALTQLVAGYYGSSPGYPGSEIQRLVDETTSTVTSQLNHRREAVEGDAVVDVRTRLMWYTRSVPVTTDPAADTVGGLVAAPGDGGPFSSSLPRLPDLTLKAQPSASGGWKFPTRDQLEGLIRGWNGQPSDWLMRNAGFPAPLMAGAGSERNWELWTANLTSYQSQPAYRSQPAQVTRGYHVVNMANGAGTTRLLNGASSQHGYIPVRETPAGAYVP